MNLPQRLDKLEDAYHSGYRAAAATCSSPPQIGELAEHLSRMFSQMSGHLLALREQIAPDIMVATQSHSPHAQNLEDAAHLLEHSQHLLEASETLTSRASYLLEKIR